MIYKPCKICVAHYTVAPSSSITPLACKGEPEMILATENALLEGNSRSITADLKERDVTREKKIRTETEVCARHIPHNL